jgi:hypothetical protein
MYFELRGHIKVSFYALVETTMCFQAATEYLAVHFVSKKALQLWKSK